MADPWLPDLAVEVDEERRWIIIRRTMIGIACNLGNETVEVPVTGEPLAGWGDPKAGTDATTLPPHSVAVLRTH
jgi:maltooligosyltrehalose trehalohydrolase